MNRKGRSAGWLLGAALLLILVFPSAAQQYPGLIELGSSNLTAIVNTLAETHEWVLMEFYAHWCPACQAFQPEYISTAAQLQARGDAVPTIAVARIDCADNQETCEAFQISSYPTMYLGKPNQFTTRSSNGLLKISPRRRDAKNVIKEVGEKLQMSLDSLERTGEATQQAKADIKVEEDAGGDGVHVVKPMKALLGDLLDIEGATMKSWEYALSAANMRGPQARDALVSWLQLLAQTHPLERCRLGAREAQGALDEAWPRDQDAVEDVEYLRSISLCGPDAVFEDEWSSCKGNDAGSRGYTCGLWQLFHALSTRLPSTQLDAGRHYLEAVKGYIKHYFQCSDCASHFLQYATSPEAMMVTTKRDAVMWMWRTHNIVNQRLAEEGASAVQESNQSKVQWPVLTDCTGCRDPDGNWDENDVYPFLVKYYHGTEGEGRLFVESLGAPAKESQRRSSWGDATFLCVMLTALVYSILRPSGQYGVRKSLSRLL